QDPITPPPHLCSRAVTSNPRPSRSDYPLKVCNLSTHTTPEVKAWLSKNPHIHFHFTPVGSSWLNQIEIWFGILTRQSIRRGTFSSVNVLVKQIRDYISSWNQEAKPFTWTATADEVLAKVRLVQTNVKKLVNNNSK
ncbi:transposase, partial [Streptomyces sp. NPDC001982]|uniref:transposase n=1 Tax=Streptomyces sp. NPDC001982 TaxID=3154405 RepID=UPI003319EC28